GLDAGGDGDVDGDAGLAGLAVLDLGVGSGVAAELDGCFVGHAGLLRGLGQAARSRWYLRSSHPSPAAPSGIHGQSPPERSCWGMWRPWTRRPRHRLTSTEVPVSSFVSRARPIPNSGQPSCMLEPRGRMLRSPS